EATPLFSRPYLYCQREVTQYLRFKELVADSQQFRGANPKYWVTAMPCGIFFEIWPFEKGHALTAHPYGV
ncbi:MAG: hypothetical protein JSW15_08435, partial [Deltaproteobacteria bacterium]